MEIADKWIQLGYAIKTVLKIVGILEATYYARRKNQGKPKVYNGGRPIPGYSMKKDGQPVADEQIKEWIHEYTKNQHTDTERLQFVCVGTLVYKSTKRKCIA